MKRASWKGIVLMWISMMPGVAVASVTSGAQADKADSLFRVGAYEAAVSTWQALERQHGDHPAISYNVALALWQAGLQPEAMLALEKARRMAPGDADIRQAWQAFRAGIDGMVIPVESFFLQRLYRHTITLVRPGGWAMAAAFAFGVALFVAFRLRDNNREATRRYTSVMWGLVIVGGVLLATGLLAYRHLFREDEAVCFFPCVLHAAPAAESPGQLVIAAGEWCRVTDSLGDWKKIRLLNLDEGWVPDTCLRRIILTPRP